MKPHKSSKCGVCATPHFERNNYFYGKQFTVRDLLQEQSYFNGKRQLVNRMVLGWGVVCGLEVRWEPTTRGFVVEAGMALDCCGHEIIVCEPQHVAFEDYEEQCRVAREKPEHTGKFVLCLEYDECHAEPVELPAVGCDDDERVEFNRVRDGFKLRVKTWEEACPKQPSGHVACLDYFKHDAGASPETPDCRTENLHHYLCHKLTEGCPACEECDCVVLATIYVRGTSPTAGQTPPPAGYAPPEQPKKQDEYQSPGQPTDQKLPEPELDLCTDRRFVYNNSLLYDLIYCYHGDLPHVVDFNWRKRTYPAREINIQTFVQMMKEGLTVYFDREMTPASLNQHTFIVSYLHRDSGTQTYREKRIPAKEIRTGRVGDCYTATFIAKDDWLRDELDTGSTELRADTRYEPGVSVEITLRGSRIWSTRGKGLDGDFLADKLPTGNGTQGGDFVDWFLVVPHDEKEPKGESYVHY
jgi:hypothetical protein